MDYDDSDDSHGESLLSTNAIWRKRHASENLDSSVRSELPQNPFQPDPVTGLGIERQQISIMTAEETIALTSPAWMQKNEAGKWVEMKPTHALRQPFIPEAYSYDLCDEQWTIDDEDKLGNSWTFEDEEMLGNLELPELQLWKKCKDTFDIPLPEILPKHMFVDRSGLLPKHITLPLSSINGSKLTMPKTGLPIHLEQKLWGQDFSEAFLPLLDCPAFGEDLRFLQYILEYAVSLRLSLRKPQRPIAPTVEGDDPFSRLQRSFRDYGHDPLPSKFAEAVNLTFGADNSFVKFPYLGLVEDLKKQDKEAKVDQVQGSGIGLLFEDISKVVEAWDNGYLNRSSKDVERIETYYNNSNKKCNPKKMKSEIRSWILSCRRNEAQMDKEKRKKGMEEVDIDPSETNVNLRRGISKTFFPESRGTVLPHSAPTESTAVLNELERSMPKEMQSNGRSENKSLETAFDNVSKNMQYPLPQQHFDLPPRPSSPHRIPEQARIQQEDSSLHTELNRYEKISRPAKKDSTCPNCKRLGHRLRHCRKCDSKGFLPGCMKCDTLFHRYEFCRLRKPERDDNTFLLNHRIHQPPVYFSRDIREIEGYIPGFHLVWTPEFAMRMLEKGDWKTHVYLIDREEEEHVRDPAWDNPEAIPTGTFANNYVASLAAKPQSSINSEPAINPEFAHGRTSHQPTQSTIASAPVINRYPDSDECTSLISTKLEVVGGLFGRIVSRPPRSQDTVRSIGRPKRPSRSSVRGPGSVRQDQQEQGPRSMHNPPRAHIPSIPTVNQDESYVLAAADVPAETEEQNFGHTEHSGPSMKRSKSPTSHSSVAKRGKFGS